MRANDIKPGLTLVLKPQNPYGYTGADRLILVTELRERGGYRVPWVYSDRGVFKPQDFQKVADVPA